MGKSRRIHIDIETYRTRNPALVAKITDDAMAKRPANNTAKAIKETWNSPQAQRDRAAEALDKTALDPLCAEILCVCCKTEGCEPDTFDAMDTAVHGTMLELAEYLADVTGPETIWTGFNIKLFDLPVLLANFQRAGVCPGDWFPAYMGNRRWYGRIFDSMERCPSQTPFISLNNACLAYGIDAKTIEWQGKPMGGSRVAEAFEAGEFEMILDYCITDVVAEEALYLAMTFNDRWGTYSDKAELREQIAEIDDSDLSPGQKAITQMQLIRAAGLI